MIEQHKEFILLAFQEGADFARLCRKYGISRKSGYKRLNKHRAGVYL